MLFAWTKAKGVIGNARGFDHVPLAYQISMWRSACGRACTRLNNSHWSLFSLIYLTNTMVAILPVVAHWSFSVVFLRSRWGWVLVQIQDKNLGRGFEWKPRVHATCHKWGAHPGFFADLRWLARAWHESETSTGCESQEVLAWAT